MAWVILLEQFISALDLPALLPGFALVQVGFDFPFTFLSLITIWTRFWSACFFPASKSTSALPAKIDNVGSFTWQDASLEADMERQQAWDV